MIQVYGCRNNNTIIICYVPEFVLPFNALVPHCTGRVRGMCINIFPCTSVFLLSSAIAINGFWEHRHRLNFSWSGRVLTRQKHSPHVLNKLNIPFQLKPSLLNSCRLSWQQWSTNAAQAATRYTFCSQRSRSRATLIRCFAL